MVRTGVLLLCSLAASFLGGLKAVGNSSWPGVGTSDMLLRSMATAPLDRLRAVDISSC